VTISLQHLQDQRFSLLGRASADLGLTDQDFRVLYRLLDRLCRIPGDRFGKMWPSAATIAEEVGSQVRSARRSLKRLAAAGYIRQVSMGGGRSASGMAVTAIYALGDVGQLDRNPKESADCTVTLETAVTAESSLTVTVESSNGDPGVLCAMTLEAPNPIKINNEKNPEESSASTACTGGGSAAPISMMFTTDPAKVKATPRWSKADEATFQDFYRAFPLQEAEDATRKAYRAALKRGASAGDLLTGARQFADQMAVDGREAKYITRPENWLAGGCWKDVRAPTAPISNMHGHARQPRGAKPSTMGIFAEIAANHTDDGDFR